MKPNHAIGCFILLCYLWTPVFSQVKVAADADLATATDPSAVLEMFSTTKGMLPPRMTTVQRDAIVTPAEGLMIYNTTENCLNELRSGVWKTYCDLRFSAPCNCIEYLKDNGLPTQAWIPMETVDWGILGNTGTNPTTNFLGTTDNQDLSIRANALEKWRFRTNGTISYHNTGGSVLLGEFAGYNDDLSNNNNTFLGIYAGHLTNTGYGNVAVGQNAMQQNTTGYRNVAIGGKALSNNTTGITNTAVGDEASFGNLTGVGNTAVGNFALNVNTTGHYNTSMGYHSLVNLNSGRSNVGIGYRATGYLENGNYNVGIGESACRGSVGSATAFSHVIGIGRNTFVFKGSGDYSVAIGTEACFQESTGGYNVGIGYSALSENEQGSNLTAIGSDAGIISPVTATYTNSVGLGSATIINSSDKIRIGNSAITVVEGQVAYSWPSDARFKSRIKENVPGLDFVMGLRPVTYQFDTRKFDEFLLRGAPDSVKTRTMGMTDYSESQNIVHTGFLAQEIETLVNKLGYDFDGLQIPEHEQDNYSVSYSTFVVPLVKAMQEQQGMIKDLKAANQTANAKVEEVEKTVESQQAMIDRLIQRIEKLEGDH